MLLLSHRFFITPVDTTMLSVMPCSPEIQLLLTYDLNVKLKIC